MPGATVARLVSCAWEMAAKLDMMPQTVPNKPTNGAAFARLGQETASFVEERALALLARPAEVARDDAPRRRADTP